MAPDSQVTTFHSCRATFVGRWRFRLSVVDVCNENRRIGGTDNITIDW
jgi:hypothetical protein